MKATQNFFFLLSASLCGLAIIMIMACSASKSLPLGPLMPESDDPEVIAKQYRESYDKWLGRELHSYTMIFSYGAHSPIAGAWEIDIVDGQVTRRVFEGQVLGEEMPMMRNMNMERLFELASAATNARGTGPFIVQASFYRDGGVASVRRIRNPAATGALPRDATWAYILQELWGIR